MLNAEARPKALRAFGLARWARFALNAQALDCVFGVLFAGGLGTRLAFALESLEYSRADRAGFRRNPARTGGYRFGAGSKRGGPNRPNIEGSGAAGRQSSVDRRRLGRRHPVCSASVTTPKPRHRPRRAAAGRVDRQSLGVRARASRSSDPMDVTARRGYRAPTRGCCDALPSAKDGRF